MEVKAEITHDTPHIDKEKKNMKAMLRDKEDRMRRSNICLIIVLEGEYRENGMAIFRSNGWSFSKIDERSELDLWVPKDKLK